MVCNCSGVSVVVAVMNEFFCDRRPLNASILHFYLLYLKVIMDSFTQIHQNTGFQYNPNLTTTDAYDDAEFQRIVDIFVSSFSTRVVQKLIETLKAWPQISLVLSALEPEFLILIKDLNGNHVVHHCLQWLSNEDNKFKNRYILCNGNATYNKRQSSISPEEMSL
ncbi:unnamed protein product [Lupinus luteus]|uniref:Uncharacterized protein n=1 Tax=Lupinus luteus TaxID=3873 RepID=A0AAV1WKJ7_LUPLU